MGKSDAKLSEAREALEVGGLKRSLRLAWWAGTEAARDEDEDELRAIIELADRIAETAEGKVREDAEMLRRYCATCLADYEAGIERRSPMQALLGRRPKRAVKRCPECAETVLEAARICRFCGHRFE
ncbi:MAG: zinc ribbon domain-containing protein [Gaiellaceae bacterium]